MAVDTRPKPATIDTLIRDAAAGATDPAVREWLRRLAAGDRADQRGEGKAVREKTTP